MPRVIDLADVLRDAGRKVKEHPNWRTHDHGPLTAVRGLMWHHTATPPSAGTAGPVSVVRNGRPGLAGPLAQLAVDRDLVWHVLSAGKAWHAGTGSWPGLSGNSDVLGIEVLHAGTSAEGWPSARLDDLRIGSAAICKRYAIPTSRMPGHKEWAPGRKIDPYGLNMADERKRVQAIIDGEEDDMPLNDADKKFIRETVQREVREELRSVAYHGRSLAEWLRRANNLAEQGRDAAREAAKSAAEGTASRVWSIPLPLGHAKPVAAQRWFGRRFAELRGQHEEMGATDPWDYEGEEESG